MRIALLLSAGGSAFAAGVEFVQTQHELLVITDRECGAESVAREAGVDVIRVEAKDRSALSQGIASAIKTWSGDCGLMMFDRLVTAPLIGTMPMLNIHPAMLPSFRGVGAPEQALQAGAKFFGATLHIAVEEVDAGPIIAQTSQPIPNTADNSWINKAAYIHKSAMFMLTSDLLAHDKLKPTLDSFTLDENVTISSSMNPTFVSSEAREAFTSFQENQPFSLI